MLTQEVGHSESPTQISPAPSKSSLPPVSRKRYSEWDTDSGKALVFGVRIMAPVIWALAIAYATYQMYLATDEFIPFQKDDLMNPGPLNWILRRGRDSSDRDWGMYTEFLFSKYVYYVLAYILLNSMIGNLSIKIKLFVSTSLSFLLCLQLIGLRGLGFLFLLPITYSYLQKFTRRKAFVWAFTLIGLVLLNFRYANSFLIRPGLDEFNFQILASWTYARCLSFTFDSWDHNKNHQSPVRKVSRISTESLASVIAYVFYFPVLTHGPIILYSNFQRDTFQENPMKRFRISGQTFMKKLIKVIGILILNEVIISYLYFGSFSLTIPALRRMNLWALGGVVYWLGQFFMLKYAVFYGLGSCLAELDGVRMPRLPKCPAHIHRYSVLWKDFDPGLYSFILRYVYIPSVQEISSHWNHRISSPTLQKWLGSLISFAYIYVWHSTAFEVFIWSAINFLGISIEKVGIWTKERIDGENIKATGEPIHPKAWDFLIEPIVTVPLAGMSILNSTIFCGNLDAAFVFTKRLVFENPHWLYVCGILYGLTHTSIGLRTYSQHHQKPQENQSKSK